MLRDVVHSLLPVRRELLCSLVVSRQPMHSALDENEAELGVLVLSVALQMLAHRHSLLDQMVKILWDLRAQSCERERRGRYRSKSGKGKAENMTSEKVISVPAEVGLQRRFHWKKQKPNMARMYSGAYVMNITDMLSKVHCWSLNHSQKIKR